MKDSLFQYFKKAKKFNREAKLFLISSFIVFLVSGGYRVIFNLYLNSLGYNSDFIGKVNSIRLIVGAALGIPLGVLATRFGNRKVLLIEGFIILASIFGMAISSSGFFLVVFSTCWGIAFVLHAIITPPFLAGHSSEKDRAHLFGLNFFLRMWAAVLGSFLGGWIADSLKNIFPHILSYKYSLSAFGVLAIGALIPIFLLESDEGNKEGEFFHVVKEVVKVSRYRDVRNFMIYSVMIGAGAGLVVPLFNIFLKLKLGASDLQIGSLMSITQVATSFGGLFTPHLVSIFGQLQAVSIFQILSIPFLIVVGTVPSFAIVSVAYFFRTSFMNMVNPVLETISMQVISEDDRPAASSLIRTIRSFGRGIGVYLSGTIMATGNYILPFILTCSLYLAASLYFYFSFRTSSNLVQGRNAVANN